MTNRSHVHRIDSWANVAPAIVKAEQAGAIGLATLLRALDAGRIALLPLQPETTSSTFKVWAANTRGCPAVSLIGDDDYADRGPDGWRLARRATRWAAAVLLHAAGAEPKHYLAAVQAAEMVGRVLVVECSTTTLQAWAALVAAAPNRPNALVIAPTTGPHPVMPQRGAVH